MLDMLKQAALSGERERIDARKVRRVNLLVRRPFPSH
jgi:hypothetical protein